jgi:tetratricopeptide (TPR) repeat protein
LIDQRSTALRILFFLILVILLIIFSIYLAVLNPEPISLTLPFVGHLKDVPTIVVILSSILLGVAFAFVVMVIKETSRSVGSWRIRRRQKEKEATERLYNQGLNLMSAGRRADAIVNFNKVISRNPQFVYAYVSLGDIYISEGNYDRAIECFSRAHQLKKNSIDILIKQEKGYELARRPTEEIAVLKKIIELDNTNLYAYVKIRQLYLQLESWDEALGVQNQILSFTKSGSQKKTEQQCLVGILYEIAGKNLQKEIFSEAIKQYRDIVKNNQDFVPAYLKLAEAYQASGDTEEAIRMLVKANKQFPTYLYFPYLEELYLSRDNPSAIIETYKDAIRRSPSEVRLSFLLGKLYLRLEMLDEAMGQFEDVLSKGTEFPLVHFMIGEVHDRFRRYQEAGEAYKKAAQIPAEGNGLLYNCTTCHNRTTDWRDRCPHCHNWNTFQMEL